MENQVSVVGEGKQHTVGESDESSLRGDASISPISQGVSVISATTTAETSVDNKPSVVAINERGGGKRKYSDVTSQDPSILSVGRGAHISYSGAVKKPSPNSNVSNI